MAYANFILTIFLVFALVYTRRKNRKEEEELQFLFEEELRQNIKDAFKSIRRKSRLRLKRD